jgi:S1-C subfamily serine protease
LVVPKGVYVTAVTANGPSAIAGLAVGDTITKMGQTEINENVLFEELLEAVKPADPVTFKVLRAGKTIDITITAGTLK